LTERRTELGITIKDQISLFAEEAVEPIGQIPGDLFHLLLIGVRCGPCKIHPSRRKLYQKQHVVRDQAAAGPNLDRKEVRRRQAIPASLQKGAPGGSFPTFRGRFDAVSLKDMLIVVRPTSKPRFPKAPRMVV